MSKNKEVKYFDIIGNFCEIAPFIEGYSAFHCALYLIIFDACNKNFWRPTAIDYSYLMNKIGMNKRTYLKSRIWLQENGFIKFTPGQNEYSKATFEVAVQICTSDAPHHAPLVHLSYTAPRTSGAPSIYKQLNNNNNQLNNNISSGEEKNIDENLKIEFGHFHKLYPGTKRGLEIEFENLKKKHKNFKEIIPILKKELTRQFSEKQKQADASNFVAAWKNMSTYINNQAWTESFQIQQISKQNDTHPPAPVIKKFVALD